LKVQHRGRPRLSVNEVLRRRGPQYLKNREKLIAAGSQRLRALRPRVADAFAVLRALDKEARLRDASRKLYADWTVAPPDTQWRDGQEYAQAYKEARPCMDCGQSFPFPCMDFDHVRGVKKKDVSSCNTLATVKTEIAKCDVVCANCHRLRTYIRQRLPLPS
jgi:hypothetical protein